MSTTTPIVSDADKIGETRFGKDISIRRRPDGRLFEIVVAGGGKKPREFDGVFTRHYEAKAVIDAYITTVKRAELIRSPGEQPEPPAPVEPPKIEDECPVLPETPVRPVVQGQPKQKATLSLKK